MNKIACAIFSFDRPNYLKKTIDSIIQSYKNCSVDIDFHFFQDSTITIKRRRCGSEKGEKEAQKLLEAYKKELPSAKLYTASYNLGVANQKAKAHLLFKNYSKVMFFEDDMIISPYYLQLIINMSKQFPDSIVQACDRTGGLPNDDFKNHLNEVFESNCHLWGYLMSEDTCSKIDPLLKRYLKFVGDDYQKRPESLIREHFQVKASSHDAILTKAMKKNDVKKFTTRVPRAKYIGEKGIHADPQWFKKFNFHKDKPYIFEQDKDLKEFKEVS